MQAKAVSLPSQIDIRCLKCLSSFAVSSTNFSTTVPFYMKVIKISTCIFSERKVLNCKMKSKLIKRKIIPMQ